MSALYVVATPIGNLEDISLRALRILGQVKLIAAEDTRTTRHLLKTYDIKASLTSYYEHNKMVKMEYLLNFLKDGDVALVSEAGMPGLSDTGYELISAAIERGIPVIPVPGASAATTALIVSGLPTDQFLYLGFLPRQKGERHKLLRSVAEEIRTILTFESPHRLLNTFKDMLEILGDRQIAVCREMTKIHEEIFRDTISKAIEHFAKPRGEFTIVIAGKKKGLATITTEIEREIIKLHKQGYSAREALPKLSKSTGISKKKLYQIWIQLSKGDC